MRQRGECRTASPRKADSDEPQAPCRRRILTG
jgi:hypothetical protein